MASCSPVEMTVPDQLGQYHFAGVPWVGESVQRAIQSYCAHIEQQVKSVRVQVNIRRGKSERE